MLHRFARDQRMIAQDAVYAGISYENAGTFTGVSRDANFLASAT